MRGLALTAALQAAADARQRHAADGVVRLAGGGQLAGHQHAQVVLGEAAVAAGGAERADVAGVGPAAERGLVDAEELAGLPERYPAGGKAFGVIAIATIHGRTSLNCAKRGGRGAVHQDSRHASNAGVNDGTNDRNKTR